MRRCLAEFIGTFVLVFTGCGAIVVDRVTGGVLTHLGVAVAFGLAVMAMIYATGHVSGAHLNPAVTLAFALTRHFPPRRVGPYLVSQVAGALAAAGVLRLLFGEVARLGATQPHGAELPSLVLEFILTAVLMFVIMAVATDTRAVGEAAAIAIGGTVALAALFGGPISGASLNPARSLGPALVSGDLTTIWLYLVGPIAGALTGAFLYQFLRGGESPASQQERTDAYSRSLSLYRQHGSQPDGGGDAPQTGRASI